MPTISSTSPAVMLDAKRVRALRRFTSSLDRHWVHLTVTALCFTCHCSSLLHDGQKPRLVPSGGGRKITVRLHPSRGHTTAPAAVPCSIKQLQAQRVYILPGGGGAAGCGVVHQIHVHLLRPAAAERAYRALVAARAGRNMHRRGGKQRGAHAACHAHERLLDERLRDGDHSGSILLHVHSCIVLAGSVCGGGGGVPCSHGRSREKQRAAASGRACRACAPAKVPDAACSVSNGWYWDAMHVLSAAQRTHCAGKR